MPERADRPRIMLAATGSGCGKTTVTCAVLRALVRRGLTVQAFKCGADYIDPMFHSRVTGRGCGSLDSFLLPEGVLRGLFRKNSEGADCSVIEGVMGFYDGLGAAVSGSSYEIAVMTRTPVILILNARGASMSLAAAVKGFKSFRENSGIAGVILNECGENLCSRLKPVLEEETGAEVLGCMPRMEDCSLESRRLGLVMPSTARDLEVIADCLAAQAERSLDLNRILELASHAPRMKDEPSQLAGLDFKPKPFLLAVAKDEAFCFYYRDALNLLEEAGAEIVFFSPLNDDTLPNDVHGLYMGGGYPELHAARLSSNASMLGDIRSRVNGGLPTIAECGGFMALCGSIRTEEGTFGMSGVIESEAYVTSRLVRFGYVEMTARRPSVVADAGRVIRAHEFHYCDSTDNGDGFVISKPSRHTSSTSWEGVHASETLYAGFPHAHLCGDPLMAVKFARACSAPRPPFIL